MLEFKKHFDMPSLATGTVLTFHKTAAGQMDKGSESERARERGERERERKKERKKERERER